MTRAPSTVGEQTAQVQRGPRDLRDVELDQFLELLIAEMQNQDPLDPLDNSEILQQISQIREISATDQLSDTLQAVLTGQNLTTASSLIGKQITALTDDAENIVGIVDRVSVETSPDDDSQRILRVHVGQHRIELKNIREIVDETDG